MFKRLIEEVINVLFSITVAVVLFILIRSYFVQPFQVEGHSMDLTLSDGYQMLMYKQSKIERFDIIVFPDPMGSKRSFVKRVIGLPGDTLSVENDQLILNGIIMDEPYLEPLKSQTEGVFTNDFSLWDTLGIEIIPEGYFFVMGDNRPSSGDSRQFGLVPIESVQGETNFVYYPFDTIHKVQEYQLNDEGYIILK